MDSLSELSSVCSLSPVPPGDEYHDELYKEQGAIKKFPKLPKDEKEALQKDLTQTAKRDRAPSPPHEFILADNPDIAFIVMFRNRLADAFPRSMAAFGPQELERDVVDSIPGERIESFLCALLKLLLNRQHDVKPGHYNKALEEAVQLHGSQGLVWVNESPLTEGRTFAMMTPTDRLTLLRAIILWTMSSSKVVHDIIDHIYKGKRNEDDSNIVMSVQPWGSDSDKRRYFVIEGQDGTAFRVYRESGGFVKRTWWSVAASIDELRALIEKLEIADGGPKAKKLALRLKEEIPRIEATEEKRRRREYRQMRKDQFKRSDPGFSVYEGRTRGKRVKYTYSDNEISCTDSPKARRSARNRVAVVLEPTTASGRQVRASNRIHRSQELPGRGNILLAGGDADMEDMTGRPYMFAPIPRNRKEKTQENIVAEYDTYDSTEDLDSEPDFGDEEDEDQYIPDEKNDGDDLKEGQDLMLDKQRSAVVKLPIHVFLNINTGKWQKVTVNKGVVEKCQKLVIALLPNRDKVANK